MSLKKLSAVLLFCSLLCQAQTPTGTITGRVVDPSSAVISGAIVEAINVNTSVRYSATTNSIGQFTIPNLLPSTYKLEISKPGFRTLVRPDIAVHVQDILALNFTLPVGAPSEIVTVEGGAPLVNTEDASVSTVIDRNFAENLPMNGRSFQTLIELAPGTVLTTSNANDNGQFSINGQRAASNYWMVDGVSANIGIGTSVTGTAANGLAGSVGSFSALGGTNSLVSIDAMEEFRIQTSTYAPEFGRTPGGQISIATRSGTNRFHGTLFDYLRNDLFDANNWFADNKSLPKPKERQNDFGGTFSGPFLKDRAFFFFSYEGLRLRLPQVGLRTVPDQNARQNAIAAMQPFLNAFPLPNGADNVTTGIAQFNASYSDPGSLDAYSLRLDHKLTNRWTLFGRYNYSPSEITQRGNSLVSLSTVPVTRTVVETGTVGGSWMISPIALNDLRFNYSQATATVSTSLDNFGGAVPITSFPFPSPFTFQNSRFGLTISGLTGGVLQEGLFGKSFQQQFNIVDSFSLQEGPHGLKFGVDFRRLSPTNKPAAYGQQPSFSNVASARNGTLRTTTIFAAAKPTFLFRNLGVYAQDTWHLVQRLTITYGLRWDVDYSPQSLEGPDFPAVNGFNLNDLSSLSLAPTGTSPYQTQYSNIAPRVGLAYELFQNGSWQTVLRGGFGIFYDLASSEAGNLTAIGAYPFGASARISGGAFPLTPAAAGAPAIVPPTASNGGGLFAFDPQLQLPYTQQWNVALAQSLGDQQALTISYVGAAGRRLIQTAALNSPNANFGFTELVTNAGTSSYNALQLEFRHRLSHNIQIIASHTWSHSIDTGSAGSAFGSSANTLVPASIAGSNRGPSDFDIRQSFSLGLTYNIPQFAHNKVLKAVLGGWSTESLILARSAPPVEIIDANLGLFNGGVNGDVRPDLIAGVPLYLMGSMFPGGKAFNPAAFTDPPFDQTTFTPHRQGTVPRNFLRGFGATEWDFAIHRELPIHESLKLQFRSEMFNVLNHPNFGPPSGVFGIGGFGISTQTLGQSLSKGNVGAGGLNPLYQIGGPRSIQLALKLLF